MRYCAKTKGFSTVELLTVIAVLAILASILLGVGKRLQTQAEEKLADGMVDVLVSALEQYYGDHGEFPTAVVDTEPDGDIDEVDFGVAVGEVVTFSGVPQDNYCWSSSALYYFLSRTPSSRRIIETLTDRLISNKDSAGVVLQIEIPAGSGTIVDLIRFIDPWGNSILYTYIPSNNFPLIVSAGPDGVLNTADDINSK